MGWGGEDEEGRSRGVGVVVGAGGRDRVVHAIGDCKRGSDPERCGFADLGEVGNCERPMDGTMARWLDVDSTTSRVKARAARRPSRPVLRG